MKKIFPITIPTESLSDFSDHNFHTCKPRLDKCNIYRKYGGFSYHNAGQIYKYFWLVLSNKCTAPYTRY